MVRWSRPRQDGVGAKHLANTDPRQVGQGRICRLGVLGTLVEVTAPIPIELSSCFNVHVTLSFSVQLSLAARLPPLNEKIFAPGAR